MHLGRLGSDSGTLACHGLETRLDAGDGAARPARLTLQEVEPRVLL